AGGRRRGPGHGGGRGVRDHAGRRRGHGGSGGGRGRSTAVSVARAVTRRCRRRFRGTAGPGLVLGLRLGVRGAVGAYRLGAGPACRPPPVGPLRQLLLEGGVEDRLVHGRLFARRHLSSASYSGPLMPPSLRIRQKWTARNSTRTNGKASTCNTYHRKSVFG